MVAAYAAWPPAVASRVRIDGVAPSVGATGTPRRPVTSGRPVSASTNAATVGKRSSCGLRHRLVHRGGDVRRHVRRPLPSGVRLLVDDLEHDLGDRRARERGLRRRASRRRSRRARTRRCARRPSRAGRSPARAPCTAACRAASLSCVFTVCEPRIFEMPKSSTLATSTARPSTSVGTRKMFCGLRSRWTMPGAVRGRERRADLAHDRQHAGRAAAARPRAAARAIRPPGTRARGTACRRAAR